MPPRLNLIVLRCKNIEASVAFYRQIGLTFEKHRHDSGPEHYASSDALGTLELYPASARSPVTHAARIGFEVDSVDLIASSLIAAGYALDRLPSESPWGRRAVAVDPDGHRVELTESRQRQVD